MSLVSLILSSGMALAFVTGARGDDLRVALGEVDITPPIGSPMAGYEKRSGNAESVHDRLTAGLVLFAGADTSLALITFDLVDMASSRIIEAVKGLGIEHVIMASSHTHSGPDTDNAHFPSTEDSWKRATEDKVIDMVRAAREDLFPASIGAGKGSIQIGFNRRRVDDSGKVKMLWGTAEGNPTRPADPTVGVIRIDDVQGRPRAVLVHYACHAVVLMPDNLAISADYPGAMRRKLAELVEKESGERIRVFFLQGAAGDVKPYGRRAVDQGAFASVERLGSQLAEDAHKVYKRLATQPQPATGLRVIERAFEFEHRWEPDKRVGVNLTTVLIGDDLALAAIPGEPFVDFQIELAGRSPIPNTFLIGYALSDSRPWPGYIPTIQAAAEGGYGAGYRTEIEVGAGETLANQAVISLYGMTGRLRDTPEQ